MSLTYIKKCFRVYHIFCNGISRVIMEKYFYMIARCTSWHCYVELQNYPWVKTGVWKLIPMYLTDCTCDLLIVIANANQTGNWCLERWEPIASTGGDKVIHGIKCVLPSCCPPMRQTSSTHDATFVSISLAPLQSIWV